MTFLRPAVLSFAILLSVINMGCNAPAKAQQPSLPKPIATPAPPTVPMQALEPLKPPAPDSYDLPPPVPVIEMADRYIPVRDAVAPQFTGRIEKDPRAGISVAMVDGQDLVWLSHYGAEEAAKNIPSSAASVYCAGPIAMPLVALACMRLAEEGMLDLDRPIQEYWPDFPIHARTGAPVPLTVRQILSHHAGLPSEYLHGLYRETIMSRADLLSEISNEWFTSNPGTVFVYSEFAYGLLGDLIERITKTPFPRFIRDHVLIPLGMVHASFDINDGIEHQTRNYDENLQPAPLYPQRDIAAMGLYATITDLARLIQVILAEGGTGQKSYISAQNMAETLKPQNEKAIADNGFLTGLGWFLSWHEDPSLGRIAWMDGGPMGFNACILISLDHQLGVAALGHRKNSPMFRNNLYQALRLAIDIKTGTPYVEVPPPASMDIPVEVLETVSGMYATHMGASMLTRKENRLILSAQQYSLDLAARPDGRFGLEYRLAGMVAIPISGLKSLSVTFSKDAHHQYLQFYDGPRPSICTQINPMAIPEAWTARLGKYNVANAQEDAESVSSVELAMEGEFLTMACTVTLVDMVVKLPILPLSDTDAMVGGEGERQGGHVTIIMNPDGERIRYSGYEFAPAS